MESDSDTYKNSYDCPRCTEKMPSKPIDEELDHGLVLACPECGKEKLSVECFLHWDKKRRLLVKGESNMSIWPKPFLEPEALKQRMQILSALDIVLCQEDWLR